MRTTISTDNGVRAFWLVRAAFIVVCGPVLLVGCGGAVVVAKAVGGGTNGTSSPTSNPTTNPTSNPSGTTLPTTGSPVPVPTGPATPISGGSPTNGPLPPMTPPPSPVNPPAAPPVPAPLPVIGSVTNFGDSITCAYLATPRDGAGNVWSNSGYAGLLDAELGVPAQNLCRSGDEAEDMARMWVYPYAMPELGQSQLYTMLIGTNDMFQCGGYAVCVEDWKETTSASLAWLAIPKSDKVFATQMKQTAGTWTQDAAINVGESTTTSGSTLTFAVNQAVAGRQLYLAYRVFAPWLVANSTATVTVDGVAEGTMNSLPYTGLWIATSNGVYDTVFLKTVPLGGVGQHTVTVQMTSADGTFFSLLWAGVPQQDYATVAGAPRVVIGYVPNTGNDTWNTGIAMYNQALPAMVQSLVEDGMYITIAPTQNILDPATDFNTDLLHPNDAGHLKLKAAFASVM